MKIYTAINEKERESFSSTSATALAGFVGCNPNYLRDRLRESNVIRLKGFVCSVSGLEKIKGRGKY